MISNWRTAFLVGLGPDRSRSEVSGCETFRPQAKKVADGGQGKAPSASFFNHGKTYFADNGTGAIRCLNQDNQWMLLHQEDLSKDKRRKPNDLVVDRSGGVYFTLTGPGEVVYVSPQGKAQTVASGVQTPNGLILSPDEKTLYVSEYVPKKILSFRVGKNGALNAKKLFAKMDDGQPDLKGADGMCVIGPAMFIARDPRIFGFGTRRASCSTKSFVPSGR